MYLFHFEKSIQTAKHVYKCLIWQTSGTLGEFYIDFQILLPLQGCFQESPLKLSLVGQQASFRQISAKRKKEVFFHHTKKIKSFHKFTFGFCRSANKTSRNKRGGVWLDKQKSRTNSFGRKGAEIIVLGSIIPELVTLSFFGPRAIAKNPQYLSIRFSHSVK